MGGFFGNSSLSEQERTDFGHSSAGHGIISSHFSGSYGQDVTIEDRGGSYVATKSDGTVLGQSSDRNYMLSHFGSI